MARCVELEAARGDTDGEEGDEVRKRQLPPTAAATHDAPPPSLAPQNFSQPTLQPTCVSETAACVTPGRAISPRSTAPEQAPHVMPPTCRRAICSSTNKREAATPTDAVLQLRVTQRVSALLLLHPRETGLLLASVLRIRPVCTTVQLLHPDPLTRIACTCVCPRHPPAACRCQHPLNRHCAPTAACSQSRNHQQHQPAAQGWQLHPQSEPVVARWETHARVGAHQVSCKARRS